LKDIKEVPPSPRLLTLIIFCMILMSVSIFFMRRVLVNYRDTLELFQVFLSDFKETPRSRVAKKYLVDDPIIEEDEEEFTTLTTES
jgi:hypothetical protein